MSVYSPPPAAPANDRTTLYGVVGIVGAVCCLPVGIVFGVLAIRSARRAGKPPTLGYIAVGLCALAVVVELILWATGNYRR
jgi:hypothetical protein